MRYFKITDWDQFQHYKDRAPPWIKLYNSILDDYNYSQLSDPGKAHLFAIMLLASRSSNKLPWDPKWIATRIHAKTSVNLEELEKLLFIECYGDSSTMLASCEQSARLEKRREETEKRENREETESPIGPPATKKLTEEQFLESLKANQAYTHINLGVELARMDAWLSTKPGRKKTRAFVVNWLNKIDKPIGAQNGKDGIQSTNPTINAALEWGRRHGITEITGSVWGNEPSPIHEGDNDSGVSFARLDERPKQG